MAEINLQSVNVRSNRKGFTLVEVIVVLVILAILAAILVPSLTGYIDKAKDKVAIAECRACVQAAQMILSESYGKNPGTAAVDNTEAQTLAEVDGTITAISFSDSAKVEHLSYTSKDDIVVVYCAQAGEDGCGNSEIYTVDGTMVGGATTLIYTAGTDAPNKVFNDAIAGIGVTVFSDVDSGAVAAEGTDRTGNAEKIKDYFTQNNISLSEYNIKTWALRKESGFKQPIMWWTDQDISQYQAGDKVRVIRYNSDNKTYSAGYMTVESRTLDNGANTYNILRGSTDKKYWTEYTSPTLDKQTATSKASYEETLKYYNEMAEKQE